MSLALAPVGLSPSLRRADPDSAMGAVVPDDGRRQQHPEDLIDHRSPSVRLFVPEDAERSAAEVGVFGWADGLDAAHAGALGVSGLLACCARTAIEAVAVVDGCGLGRRATPERSPTPEPAARNSTCATLSHR